MKKFFLCLVLCFVFSVSSAGASSRVEHLFFTQDWHGIDALIQKDGMRSSSPRERSLAANALWLQGRYSESAEIMKSLEGEYPPEVAPYAQLLCALAAERSGKVQESYKGALSLYSGHAPSLIRYYTMYLLSRLTSNDVERAKWLRRMIASTSLSSQKLDCLNALAAMDFLTTDEAMLLLKLAPNNKKALAICSRAPDSPQKFYRLGYSAYLKTDYKKAVSFFAAIPPEGPFSRAAAYHLGVSHQRLGDSPAAVPYFKRLIFPVRTNYTSRSLARLSLMQGGKAAGEALALLKNAVKSDDPRIAASALYSLGTSRYAEATPARAEFLRRFPSDSRASSLLWQDGWKAYMAGNYREAIDTWKRNTAADGLMTAAMLYWSAEALDATDRHLEAEALRLELHRRHSLTFYSFQAFGNDAFITDETPLPDNLTPAPPSVLEQWGFVTHAQMNLAGKKDSASRMRHALLARFRGQESVAYSSLHILTDTLIRASTTNCFSQILLEMEYPRPFRDTVEREAAANGIDPRLVWAVMKQESHFDPKARSWVGAAGLMQLMPKTASYQASKMKLSNYNIFRPGDNITLGTAYFAGLLKRFKKCERAIASYNGGPTNVSNWEKIRGTQPADMWTENIPFSETRNYVKKVYANYRVYCSLYPYEGFDAEGLKRDDKSEN